MAENFDLIFGSSASQSYSWNDSDYQNGWQKVGDTPPTREQFDALQRRADLKAQELNNRLAPIEENDTHDYRQPSTTYTAGQIKYHATLPTGWYLECTTDGTTDAGALVITSPSVGDTVTDGTVVWTINKSFPVTGGVLAGQRIYRGVDDEFLTIRGATNSGTSGAYITLYGKENASNAGGVVLHANDTNDSSELRMSATGAFALDGNDLAGSAIVAKSLGTNGYIKYASGLIIQWGTFTSRTATAVHTVTFPIAFPTKVFGICPTAGFNVTAIGDFNVSGFNVYTYQAGTSLATSSREVSGTYFAIGY